jgi:hypothetical protein
MSTSTDVARITYPQSDGQPMADNTKQFRWIVTIQGGLDALLRTNPQVFVGGDLLWYPVEGHPEMCMAPDVLVAFGRPKDDRVPTCNGRRAASPRRSSLQSAPQGRPSR